MEKLLENLKVLIALPVFSTCRNVYSADAEAKRETAYYYLTKNERARDWSFLTTADGATKTKSFLDRELIQPNPFLTHIERLKEFLNRTDRLNHWNEEILGLIGNLYADTKVDSVARVTLVNRFLNTAVGESELLRLHLAEIASIFDKHELDTAANWVLPSDDDAIVARPKARMFLEKNQSKLDSAIENARIAMKQISAESFPVVPNYAGWLMRDDAKTIQFRAANDVKWPKTGELAVLSTNGAVFSFQRIGTVVEGKPILKISNEIQAVSGDRVYVRPISRKDP